MQQIVGSYYKRVMERVTPGQSRSVRWWRYTVSHRQLHLRLGAPTAAEPLFVVGEACWHISGPTAQLACAWEPRGGVVLTDAAAQFRMECRSIYVYRSDAYAAVYDGLGS